jgi:hypothetical protein
MPRRMSMRLSLMPWPSASPKRGDAMRRIVPPALHSRYSIDE